MATLTSRVALRAGGLAICLLVLSMLVPAQGPSWAQNAHYAFVRALADGTPRIDKTIGEVTGGTGDVARFRGHLYAAKAPGFALANLPAYLVLRAVGRANAGIFQQLWTLGIWSTVLPALILLLLVRRVAEEWEPGYGTAAAVTLGAGTLLLPFSTLFFSHLLAILLGFAAFVVLRRVGEGHTGGTRLLLAGVLAGFSITTEFPMALLAAALAGYVLACSCRLVPGAVYSAGVAVGVVPLLAYNEWAFGSPLHLSYANVVGGLNRAGFFGVQRPSLHVAAELLFSRIGLLTLSPVLALGVVGVIAAYRQGRRPEALLITSLALGYLLFNASYETPFGGFSPGPRHLLPVLPFVACALGTAYRRFPLTTIALAAVAVVEYAVISVTRPLLAVDGGWFDRFASEHFSLTAFGFLGIGQIYGVAVFVLGVALACLLAVAATRRSTFAREDALRALVLLCGWFLVQHYSSPLLAGTLLRGVGGSARLALVWAIPLLTIAAAVYVPRTLRPGVSRPS